MQVQQCPAHPATWLPAEDALVGSCLRRFGVRFPDLNAGSTEPCVERRMLKIGSEP